MAEKASILIVAAINLILAMIVLYACARIIWIHILR